MLVCIVADHAASMALNASGTCDPINRTLSVSNATGSTYSTCAQAGLRVFRVRSGATPMTSDAPMVPGVGFALQRRRFQVTVFPIASDADLKPNLRTAISFRTMEGLP